MSGRRANVGGLRRRLRPFTTMFVVVGMIAGAELSSAIATEFLADKERELTALMNQEREVRGLPPLPTSDALRTVTRRHTQRMMLDGRIFHSESLSAEIEEFFPNWSKLGENVGVGPDIPRTHRAFMDSTSHRGNILDNAWQTLAVGVMADGGRLYMTQRFLRLQSGEQVPPDALAGQGSSSPSPDPDRRAAASAAPSSNLRAVRVSGPTRVETAEALVEYAFAPGTADAAVLADAFDFHGALAGSALAGQVGGPTVLSSTTALDAAAADALVRALGRGSGRTVHVVGSFSDRAVEQVRALGLTPRRIGGAGFSQEAANVARTLSPKPVTAIVARIDDYPDALAASAVAAHTGWPILFTNPSSLSLPTRDAIRDLDITTVHVVGGRAAVSDGVVAEIERLGADVERHAGPSRVDTSLAIADLGIAEGLDADVVQLATARGFPDALAGGALAKRLGAPVILTEPGALSGVAAGWLRARGDDLEQVLLLGGRGALSSKVESDVRGLR